MNSLGGDGFESSCTGNYGQPEYWCADFVRWVWQHNGVDVSALSAAVGSFYRYGQNNPGTLTDSPTVGAAVVFNYHPDTGSADHVAIVTQIEDDGTIDTLSGDWNGEEGTEAQFASTSSAVLNTPSYDPTLCTTPGIINAQIWGYVTPVGLTNGGGAPPASCSCAGLNDGNYCGGDQVGGNPNTLYQCSSGALSVLQVCTVGCKVEPGTINDRCK
jgi:hypothetical protein